MTDPKAKVMSVEEAVKELRSAVELAYAYDLSDTGISQAYDSAQLALATLEALVEENAALKAELDAARPLLEAAEKADVDDVRLDIDIGEVGDPAMSESGLDILRVALAYRASKEGK